MIDEPIGAHARDDLLGHSVEVPGGAERVPARVELGEVLAIAIDGCVADLMDDRVTRGAHESLAAHRGEPVDDAAHPVVQFGGDGPHGPDEPQWNGRERPRVDADRTGCTTAGALG